MKNVLTIFRRDFLSYYTSPIGYIFMIVFLIISVGLYITTFFTFPVADMRSYFTNVPVLLCVFIPAVTMRVWAEERKENTWEMLLTFPMRAWQLVLGKFLATLGFFAMTLLTTITVPIMLAWLGNPDNGAVFGGYLGTFLVGAFFIAIGIFVSGLCKDQIVAFVVTLLVCFLIFLLGTTFIASYIDGIFPEESIFAGLGSTLASVVGVLDHFAAFTRGVLEVGDVLYFLIWTVLFLVLNMMFIEGRHRPKARATFTGATVLSIGIGLLFNWLVAGESLGRIDMTEDSIYTISDASKEILTELPAPVTVNLYITPKQKMPTAYKSLQQDLVDKLEELRIAADGRLAYNVIPLEAANVLQTGNMFGEEEEEEEEKDEVQVIEERMLDKGVAPFAVQTIEQDEVTQKLIYSSIGIGYKDKPEEIIPQVLPQNLPELEYQLVSTVYKLTRETQPLVALVAPRDQMDPQMRQIMMQMGQQVPPPQDPYDALEQILVFEKYNIERVELTKESPLPAEYDSLVVVNPEQLNDRQRWEIARALRSGKNVLMAVQNYEWNYQINRDRLNVNKTDENPQVNDLLENYGVKVADEVLMDVNHVALTITDPSNPLAALFSMGQPINLPIHILVQNTSMDQDTAITNRLPAVFYLWGSPLGIDAEQLQKHGLDAKILMRSTDQAWTVPGDAEPAVLQTQLQEPADNNERQEYPLMALITGQFPDPYADAPRPAWPPVQQQPGMPPMPQDDEEEGPAEPVEAKPGKLLLVGCAEMFRTNFIGQVGNLDLFMNSVDTLTLGDELITIRGRKPVERTIDKPDQVTRRIWQVINYGLMPLIIAGIGIAWAVYRISSRNAYTMSYAKKRGA